MENKSKYLQYALHIAILGGLVYAFAKYVNGQEVLKALQAFDYGLLPFMLGLVLLYFLSKAARFVLLMNPFAAELPKITTAKAYIAGQAATLLPGGIAARAGLMKQAGVPVAESSVPVAFSSAYDQLIFLGGGLIAALFFPAARLPVAIIGGVLLVAGATLLVKPTRAFFARQAERLAARFDKEDEWQRFLSALPQMLDKKIISGSLALTLIAFGAQIGTLALTLRGLALDVPLPTIFLAFIVPTMLGRLVPVPGGVGVTEGSMVTFLTGTAGTNTDTTVAAVVIFRLAVVVLPALLGAIVYYLLWNGEEEAGGRSPEAEGALSQEQASA